MFPFQLLLALAGDTLGVELDAWLPDRMRSAHAIAVGVAVVSGRGVPASRSPLPVLEWYHGVENGLTRSPADAQTSWPVRAFSASASSVASPHSHIGVALLPGLIALGVWSALGWVLLIPVSLFVRHGWRFGRWHEILAVLLAIPATWMFLRRVSGPVMATYFTSLAAASILLPLGLAAAVWRKSRLTSIAIVSVAALVIWQAKSLPVPLPSHFDGGPPEGATLADLGRATLKALHADSLERVRMGFHLDGDRWSAHDRSRGAEALLVLLPAREIGVIVTSNTGETTALLEEIVDSIAR